MPGIKIPIGRGIRPRYVKSWSLYWVTRYINGLSVSDTSDTTQTIIASIIGTGYSGVSWEYSVDNGKAWCEHGTSNDNTYIASELSPYTDYLWRARLFKSSNYSSYSMICYKRTLPPLVINSSIARYVSDDLTTFTRTGEAISEWRDKIGSGRDLSSPISGNYPSRKLNGVLFDGLTRYIRGLFTFNQPCFVYLVFMPISWTSGRVIFDKGINSANYALLQQYNTNTPNIAAFAGSYSAESPHCTVGSMHVVRVLFNGANSKLIVDNNAPITGNFGNNPMGGLTLGAYYSTGAGGLSNILVKECILMSNDSGESDIYSYCEKRKDEIGACGVGRIMVLEKGQTYNGWKADAIAAPSVCWDGSRYVMTVSFWSIANDGWASGFFTSTDLQTWTYINNSLIAPSPVDSILANAGITWFDNKYWFVFQNQGNPCGLWTSIDLLNWTVVSSSVVASGYDPSINVNPINGKLEIWYVNPVTRSIYLIDSSDGVTWSSPVFHIEKNIPYTFNFGAPTVWYENGVRYMVLDQALSEGYRILGLYHSPNANTEYLYDGVILRPDPDTEWESVAVSDCGVIVADISDGNGAVPRVLYVGSDNNSGIDNTNSSIGLYSLIMK